MEINISEIIYNVGLIVIAYFTYNQYRRNKKTDYEIERFKERDAQKKIQTQNAVGSIYGSLYRVLNTIKCDRVSIMQPHPMKKNKYISISYCVTENGVSSMKSYFQAVEMDRVPILVSDLSSRNFLLYQDIHNDCKDVTFRSIMGLAGSEMMAITRMVNEDNIWNGNLICVWTYKKKLNIEMLKEVMKESAETIQYILPEYDTED